MAEEFPLNYRELGEWIVTGYDLGGGAFYSKKNEPLTDMETEELANRIRDSLKENGYIAELTQAGDKDPLINVEVPSIQSRYFSVFVKDDNLEVNPSSLSPYGIDRDVEFNEMIVMKDEKERKSFKLFLNVLEKSLMVNAA